MTATKARTKIVHINVGNCNDCSQGTRTGEVYDENKFHNCNTCGYYQSYNQEMIEFEVKTNKIVWSSK